MSKTNRRDKREPRENVVRGNSYRPWVEEPHPLNCWCHDPAIYAQPEWETDADNAVVDEFCRTDEPRPPGWRLVDDEEPWTDEDFVENAKVCVQLLELLGKGLKRNPV